LAFRSTPRYTGFQRNHSERSEAVLKVLVLGAGVVGVTTAWYLAKSGVEVEVVDRQDAAGLETSFANGGQISVSHNEPWANPAMLRKAFSWLGHEDAPMLMRWRRPLFAQLPAGAAARGRTRLRPDRQRHPAFLPRRP
jgi:glycine/D-amino acid oxidase-like deaminating enzyme